MSSSPNSGTPSSTPPEPLVKPRVACANLIVEAERLHLALRLRGAESLDFEEAFENYMRKHATLIAALAQPSAMPQVPGDPLEKDVQDLVTMFSTGATPAEERAACTSVSKISPSMLHIEGEDAVFPKPMDPQHQIRSLERRFEKYGMNFMYYVNEITQPEWAPVADEREGKTTLSWTLSGKDSVQYQVTRAYLTLDTHVPIRLYATADGPILALQSTFTHEEHTLQYPALVAYQGGQLQLRPIFCAEQEFILPSHAIRGIHCPNEALLAAYPGFLVQCKMGKFNIPLAAPLHEQERDIKRRYT